MFCLLVIAFSSLLILPSSVYAGCTCRPVAGDYQVGRWVADSTGICSKNYGICVLNCVITEFDTATCIKRCFNTELSCNPMTDMYLDVGFQVPTFSVLLGSLIRLIFFIAGLFALVYLLLGGFEWVRSGGDEKKIEQARAKIVNAVIGLVVMIAVLSLVVFLEQVIFGGKICLGISCPMNIGFLRLVGN